jgi:thioredoxin 1
MSENIVDCNDDTFVSEVYDSPVPVLVDFHADWCVPCKALDLILERLDQKYDGRIKICKVNIEDAPRISQQCEILSVPKMFFVNQGEIVYTMAGVSDMTEFVLQTRIDEMLRNEGE